MKPNLLIVFMLLLIASSNVQKNIEFSNDLKHTEIPLQHIDMDGFEPGKNRFNQKSTPFADSNMLKNNSS